MAQSILIVEDNPAQRRYHKTVVSSLSYRILKVSGGQEAIDMLTAAETIDSVILDLVLSDIDGFTILDRAHPVRPDLPPNCFNLVGGLPLW